MTRTPDRASRLWEIGCALNLAAIVLPCLTYGFIGPWALLFLLLVPVGMWLGRHEQPSGPN